MRDLYKKVLLIILGAIIASSNLLSSIAFATSITIPEKPSYPNYSTEFVAANPIVPIVNSNIDSTIEPCVIVGTDSRSQVTNVNSDPFRHYVQIYTFFENGTVEKSSGFLIGDNTVITAAHCVLDFVDNVPVYASSIRVYPGGTDSNYEYKTIDDVWFSRDWYDSYGVNFNEDYAVLRLRESFNIGYMELDAISDSELSSMKNTGEYLYAFGYPYDKEEGTLWSSAGTIKDYDTNMINNYIDIVKGNSGGPLVTKDNRNVAIGICVGESATYEFNCFLRFNSQNLAQINDKRSEYEI